MRRGASVTHETVHVGQGLDATIQRRPGDPLYEYGFGEFARQQMRASGQRLGTEWMRRLDLALMAEPMTPRRLDPSIVQARLSVIRELLDALGKVAKGYTAGSELQAPLRAAGR